MANASRSEEKPSLYERLGGVYAIAAVVDDSIDRIMLNPRLNANPKVDEAHIDPLGRFIDVEQDIAGFEVAMNNASKMHVHYA